MHPSAIIQSVLKMWYVAVCTVGYVINIVGSVINLSIKDGSLGFDNTLGLR